MPDFRVHKMPPYLLGGLAESVMQARLAGKSVIDFSQVNQAEGAPPQCVESLVQASLLPQHHRYSASRGITKLRTSICEHYHKRYSVELNPDTEAVVTMGTKEGLSHLIWGIVSPGDTILLPTPAYPVHKAAIFLGGAGLIGVPLTSLSLDGESEEFFSKLEKVYKATWPRPRVMIISFPHNPTSATASLCFFDRIVEFARKNDVYLINDFAYSDICYDGYQAPSILQIRGASECAVELFSLSKAYAMPGWRVGFCLGNKDLVSALQKVKSYVDFGVFQPLQIAAIRALESGQSHQEELVSRYQLRRDILAKGLRKLGFEFEVPKATLFLWSKIPSVKSNLDSLEFSKWLLDEASVAVCPGQGFDEEAAQYLRFALVEPEERISQALQNIEAVI